MASPDPYETPTAASPPPAPAADLVALHRAGYRALAYMFSTPLLLFGWLVLVGVLGQSRTELWLVGAAIAASVGVLGFLRAATTIVRIARLPDSVPGGRFRLWFLAVPVGLLVVLATTITGLGLPFARGRQIRRRGRARFAGLTRASAWAPSPRRSARASPAADAWRASGLTEHASVAAFSRLSAELVQLGAPPRLIAGAHQDALDEIAHAELCFARATTLDGQALGPGPFAFDPALSSPLLPRSARLARLAVDALVDGAFAEGVSARVVAALARDPSVDPEDRRVYLALAKDEARHAAHGFEVVRWALTEGGPEVKAALLLAVAALPAEPVPAEGPSPSPAVERWAHATVRARVAVRTARLLGA